MRKGNGIWLAPVCALLLASTPVNLSSPDIPIDAEPGQAPDAASPRSCYGLNRFESFNCAQDNAEIRCGRGQTIYDGERAFVRHLESREEIVYLHAFRCVVDATTNGFHWDDRLLERRAP